MLSKYLVLAKPWIVGANLVSALGGYFLAGGGRAGPGLFFAAMGGIALVVASGCVCNNCLDRDIDREMARTRNRPLPAGDIAPGRAWAYGALLGLAGGAALWAGTNALCRLIVAAGFVVYVLVYTLLLKRRHPLAATVVGSLAGAAAPVAAYCAVRGRFDGGALLLLAVFSLWQIPHAHAIAIRRQEDYAAAGLATAASRLGEGTIKRHIVGHIAAFALIAPLPALCGYAGSAYGVAATVSGLAWLAFALAGPRGGDARIFARRLYRLSIAVVFVVSVMMAANPA